MFSRSSIESAGDMSAIDMAREFSVHADLQQLGGDIPDDTMLRSAVDMTNEHLITSGQP